MDATCQTSTRFCSIITGFRFTCGWIWAAKRRNWRGSWDRRAFIDAGEFDLKHYFQPGDDSAPSYYAFSFPAKMRDAYLKQWHEEHDPPLGQGAGT